MRRRKTPEISVVSQSQSSGGRKGQPPQQVQLDQLLTISQAAERLGVGRTKIYDLINNNQLPYVEIPGAGESTKRISVLTLNAWIKEHETVKHVLLSVS